MNLQRGGDLGVQPQFDVVIAQGANGMFEMNFAFIEGDIELMLELVGNGAAGDGAEHFAIVACFNFDERRELGNAAREFAHSVELVGFALGAALAKHLDLPLVGRGEGNGQSMRKKVVARVAGGDFHLV